MTVRTRTLLLVVVVVLALGGAGGYGVWAFARYQDESQAAPGVPVASKAEPGSEIIFRNTASGQGRGMVATVPAAAPQGPRMLTDQACDRVYAAGDRRICLRTKLGIENSTEELVFTPDWQQLRTRTLAGLPSRARLSADGRLASSTVFVSGHAYSGGFSTATEISATDGDSFGNLETFAVTVDGVTLTPQERNVWGVTFARDGDTFYATIGSADRNWLVRGSLRARTLTAIHTGVECPSLSPDGTRIAFKIKSPDPNQPQVRLLAVFELKSDQVTVLPEGRNVDDQAEWLNDSTLLYGLPRAAPLGDSDVWAIRADGSGQPSLLIEHAWSPAVIRE